MAIFTTWSKIKCAKYARLAWLGEVLSSENFRLYGTFIILYIKKPHSPHPLHSPCVDVDTTEDIPDGHPDEQCQRPHSG